MPPKVLFLLSLAVLLPAALLRAEPVAARFAYPTASLRLFAPEWRRDFVRAVREVPLIAGHGTDCPDLLERMALRPELPENFLLNQADGATHLYRWLRGEEDAGESYERALLRQHALSAVGPAGNRYYWNNGGAIPYASDTVGPGVFRVDLPVPSFGGDTFQLSPAELAVLTKHRYVPSSRMLPAIRGIPKRQTVPTNAWIAMNGQFSRALPQGRAETAYRAAAVLRAEKLRPWMRLSVEEARPRGDELARDLAEHYYVGIHWMPFDAINNSIFMAQVNVVLRHLGFRTMEHGRLDYFALACPPEVFAKVFTEEFRRENPDRE